MLFALFLTRTSAFVSLRTPSVRASLRAIARYVLATLDATAGQNCSSAVRRKPYLRMVRWDSVEGRSADPSGRVEPVGSVAYSCEADMRNDHTGNRKVLAEVEIACVGVILGATATLACAKVVPNAKAKLACVDVMNDANVEVMLDARPERACVGVMLGAEAELACVEVILGARVEPACMEVALDAKAELACVEVALRVGAELACVEVILDAKTEWACV